MRILVLSYIYPLFVLSLLLCHRILEDKDSSSSLLYLLVPDVSLQIVSPGKCLLERIYADSVILNFNLKMNTPDFFFKNMDSIPKWHFGPFQNKCFLNSEEGNKQMLASERVLDHSIRRVILFMLGVQTKCREISGHSLCNGKSDCWSACFCV